MSKIIKIEVTIEVEDDCERFDWVQEAIEGNLYQDRGESLLSLSVMEEK
jgi:hypothetical protein